LTSSFPFEIKIYGTVISPVPFYGCETLSLILREERRLRVFENSVLSIFGPMRDEVRGGWIKLYSKELNDLNCPSNIVRLIKSRKMRLACM